MSSLKQSKPMFLKKAKLSFQRQPVHRLGTTFGGSRVPSSQSMVFPSNSVSPCQKFRQAPDSDVGRQATPRCRVRVRCTFNVYTHTHRYSNSLRRACYSSAKRVDGTKSERRAVTTGLPGFPRVADNTTVTGCFSARIERVIHAKDCMVYTEERQMRE